MYTTVDTIDQLKVDANTFVMDNDRMLYAPFLEQVERYCQSNLVGSPEQSHILIGGDLSIDLLTKPDHKLTRDQFVWDLYACDAYGIAKKLAEDLANVRSPHIPARTIALQTNVKHREFTIYVYTRVLLRIYSMERYRGVDLAELAGTSIVVGPFTHQSIKSISPEMHLIQTYRKLYSPAMIGTAEQNLTNEAALIALMPALSNQIDGGDEQLKSVDKILKYLAAKDTPPHVHVGVYAINGDKSRLQIITDNIDAIYLGVARVIKKLRFVKYNLGIVGDFQLTNHTIYDVRGDTQIPCMDIFNSAQFEMIPFVMRGSERVGNPWVLLRFLFIDMWVLQMIDQFGKHTNQHKIDKLLRLVTKVRASALINPVASFQLDNYIGIYMDESIAKKKMIRETGDRFPTYYPAKDKINGDRTNSPWRKLKNGGNEIYYKDYPINGADDAPLVSAAINLSMYQSDKRKIILKITGDNKTSNTADMITALTHYRERAIGATKWGANKSIAKEKAKNAMFVPLVPRKREPVYLDIGCGSGIVLSALKEQYGSVVAYGADIEDTRADKNASEFILIKPGEPITLPDSSVDIISMFHVIHHMTDSPADRFVDIMRMLKPGGVLLFKDHNVTDTRTASNVDFEHFVYLVGETEKPIATLMSNFATELPMTYYSTDSVTKFAKDAGLTAVVVGESRGFSAIYHAMWRK